MKYEVFTKTVQQNNKGKFICEGQLFMERGIYEKIILASAMFFSLFVLRLCLCHGGGYQSLSRVSAYYRSVGSVSLFYRLGVDGYHNNNCQFKGT